MNILLAELDDRYPLFRVPSWTPVYLPSLGAVLRAAGHDVALVERRKCGTETDRRGNKRAPEFFAERVAGRRPDLIVFNVEPFGWGAFRRMAAAARAACPSCVMVAGGRHPTLCPLETLEYCPDIDAVLIGEPERAARDVAAGRPFHEICDIAWRSGAGTARNDDSPPLRDLDDLPMPAWDLLDLDFYTMRTPRVIPCLPLRTASIQSSRGCTAKCTFCTEGRTNAREHRFHSADYVAEEIGILVRTRSIEGIYFRDESFLGNSGRVAELCEVLMRRGLAGRVVWAAQVRTDSVSPDILRLMRRAGCIQLEFGIESGSQRVLDASCKGTSVGQNMRAIRITREAGIRSLAYVMYGMPGETRDDLLATESFLRQSDPDIVRSSAFMLLP
jgi:radical SAM superfamily enzyme YgiQ (UPF0313 family)